jgi:hypothetical protein
MPHLRLTVGLSVRALQTWFAALAVGGLVLTGCEGSAPSLGSVSTSPDALVDRALSLYDTNKDGAIDETEVKASPALSSVLSRWDTNRDKRLSEDEMLPRMTILGQQGHVVMPAQVKVTRRGRTLSGVTVRYVPDPLLGDGFTAGVGTTDASGVATMDLVEGGQPGYAGVHAGLYRVEVTGSGVPAQYNTNTTLGQEVALDLERESKDIELNF